MKVLRLGRVEVQLHDGWTLTRFPDGREVVGRHDAQPGQDATARRAGYLSAEALNRDHDLAHSLLAFWLGLPCSPALRAAALGEPSDLMLHGVEEEAVLALQRLVNDQGLQIVDLAEAWSTRVCREGP